MTHGTGLSGRGEPWILGGEEQRRAHVSGERDDGLGKKAADRSAL
jgi:hypothetical protein